MEEKKPIISMNDDIQTKLDKKLGPEYISKRIGFGSSRVAYIEGWKAINLANQIFGYNGWSTEVKSVVIDFLDERQGRFSVGCTAIVRVTLANGTYREDIGYGTVENERRKAPAFERAKKSAVTDALKRSLRGFGNALGNCLYDKDFLAKIDRVKFDPPDFDEGNLFRPSDEISEISRSNTVNPNINTNKTIAEHSPQLQHKRRQLTKIGTSSVKNEPLNGNNSSSHPVTDATANLNTLLNDPDSLSKDDDLLDDSFMFSDDFQDEDLINAGNNKLNMETNSVRVGEPTIVAPSTDSATFVTAKAATTVQDQTKVSNENVFDPKYQAQSIKHTLDQTTSKHIPLSVLKEKGLGSNRKLAYEKFAPKGKQIQEHTPTNPTENAQIPPSAEVISTIIPTVQTATTTTTTTTTATSTTSPSSQPQTAKTAQTTQPSPGTPTAQIPAAQLAAQPTEVATPTPDAANRFAPPAAIVHPNTYTPKIVAPQLNTGRREVGRPKINSMPYQRK